MSVAKKAGLDPHKAKEILEEVKAGVGESGLV